MHFTQFWCPETDAMSIGKQLSLCNADDMNSACAWMEAALTVKGPASWEIEGPPSSSMLERGSQRSAASGVWSSERAKVMFCPKTHLRFAMKAFSTFDRL